VPSVIKHSSENSLSVDAKARLAWSQRHRNDIAALLQAGRAQNAKAAEEDGDLRRGSKRNGLQQFGSRPIAIPPAYKNENCD
jgi:hypothetical protein